MKRQKKSYEELMTIRNNYLKVVTPIKRRRSLVLKVLGIGALVIAIIPNGLGFIFYPIGFMCLGISIKDINKFKRVSLYKYKQGVYKRTFKDRLLLWRSNLK